LAVLQAVGRFRYAHSKRALPRLACFGLEPVHLFHLVWNRFAKDFAGQVLSRARTSRSTFATSRQGNKHWPTTQPIWYARTTPGVRKIAVLADANVAKPVHLARLQQAAQSHGVEALVRGVAKRDDVISAINDVKASGAQAINFLATPMFSVNSAEFIRQVMTLRLPSIYQWPENAEDGALIGYGPRFTEIYRERARIAAKVLRGTKPADIPIEQPTRFELVINLKTAKAIGHEVPSGLLARADKVIE
jgi:ABC-type uncharacterized transport system substrate-binding protein